MIISIFISIWFFVVSVFSAIVAIGGNQQDWIYAFTQYLYFLACSLSVGLMNEIENKINKEDYDLTSNIWVFDWYLLFLIAHYELPKKMIRKMIMK
ncbi:hypothetical protein [Bacillus niameyensis]|uniref:hypothetical protein n=1 Tax=Bacillus niameyensis TaxID=1522308 RepID=UPI001E4580A5|nr:hypothetical protein [Bacillus niameyensis]